MKLDNKTLWNEAGRVGFVFGGFSTLCLLLKEGAALTKSDFLIQAAAIILWAVEFFGCILLMKKYSRPHSMPSTAAQIASMSPPMLMSMRLPSRARTVLYTMVNIV